MIEDAIARKLFEREHHGVDIEDVRRMKKEFKQQKEQGNSISAQLVAPRKKRTQRPKERSIVIQEDIVATTNIDRPVKV